MVETESITSDWSQLLDDMPNEPGNIVTPRTQTVTAGASGSGSIPISSSFASSNKTTASKGGSSSSTGTSNNSGNKGRFPFWILLLLLLLLGGSASAAAGVNPVYRGLKIVGIQLKDGRDGVDGNDGEDGQDGKVIKQTNIISSGSSVSGSGSGTDGADGTNGDAGADGTNGADGADGADGTNACISGLCVSRQTTSPGTQESGNINIDGAVLATQIGINDTTPSNTLTVDGTMDVSGHSAFGGETVDGYTNGSDGLSGASSNLTTMVVSEEITSITGSGVNRQALAAVLKLNPTDAPVYNQINGIGGGVEIASGNTQNFTGNLAGYGGGFIHSGTGTVTSGTSFNAGMLNLSTGTITTGNAFNSNVINLNAGGTVTSAHGLQASVINLGTITNNYGVKINTPTNGGTVTNNYGLYVADQSSVGSTLSYNLYSAGDSSLNRFNGEIQARRGQTGVRGMSFYDNNFAIGMSSTDLALTTLTGSSNGISFNDDGVSDASPLMRILGSGNVGIGKTSPTDKLQVDGTIRAGKVFFRNVDNNDAYSYIMYDGADNMKYAAYDAHTFFTESGSGLTQKLIIDGDGNVGIGSDTTPDASLEIINDASGDSFLVADSADGDTSPFVIDSTGKVGVRTASPGTNNSVFEVTGSAYISDYTYTSMIRSTVESNSKIDMYDSSSGIAFIVQNNTKDFRWAVNSGSDLMNIDGSTGSVGIGDTTPDARLDVSNTDTAGSVLQLTNSAGTCDHTPGAVTETVSCSSDQRLKTDIQAAASVLSEINGLHVYDYTIIATGQKATGLIAQDVMQTNPEMVHMGEDGYYKVDSYNSWKLLKGVQELSSNIDNLQTTFTTALEQTNGNLEQTNQKLADLGLRVDDLSATLQSYADQLADHNQRIQSLEAKVQELEQAN